MVSSSGTLLLSGSKCLKNVVACQSSDAQSCAWAAGGCVYGGFLTIGGCGMDVKFETTGSGDELEDGRAKIVGSWISDNAVLGIGGGVDSLHLSVIDCPVQGGGLFLGGDVNFTMRDSVVERNVAVEAGCCLRSMRHLLTFSLARRNLVSRCQSLRPLLLPSQRQFCLEHWRCGGADRGWSHLCFAVRHRVVFSDAKMTVVDTVLDSNWAPQSSSILSYNDNGLARYAFVRSAIRSTLGNAIVMLGTITVFDVVINCTFPGSALASFSLF